MPIPEPINQDPQTSRRDFMAQVAVGGITLAAAACVHRVAGSPPAPVAAQPVQSARRGGSVPPITLPPAKLDGPWDFAWLDHLATAKHKMMFDIGSYQNGGGLYYAKNYTPFLDLLIILQTMRVILWREGAR